MLEILPRGAGWRGLLPQGGLLPDAAWEARHRFATALLAGHLLVLPAIALSRGFGAGHLALDVVPVVVTLVLAVMPAVTRIWRASLVALGLMWCAGVVVHLSDGLTEAHFYFFVLIPVIAMYEDWLPFVLGISYVLVHHGVLGTLDPHQVYGQHSAWDRPWLFAIIHASFFAASCLASLVNWWLHERARIAERRLTADLAHRAEHDALTDLPNRAAFLNQQAHIHERRRRDYAGDVSVLMLDLDRFKEVNDTLGHTYGDHLLQQVSRRLASVTRPHDMLVRLGGDEFVVLLREADAEVGMVVAERLRQSLRGDMVVDGMPLDVDASIGIATHRADDAGPVDLQDLLRQADVAMYEAKRSGAGVAIYHPEADTHSRERLSLLAELRRAMDRRELVLHYQPKVALADNQLIGIEALVRWNHPQRGLLPPAAFIPAAEHTALIQPLTRYVIETALEQVRLWLTRGNAVPVAVNVPPRCLLEPEFSSHILECLARTGVPAAYLRLEITESTLMIDPDRARAVLSTLHHAGVRLSIDDFGTGYSSMAYLRQLPIDELKIDRSFVSGMIDRHEDDVLVQSAIDLGHNLGLTVVAEGVESDDTMRALAQKGCDTVQGYYVSRPIPTEEIATWLTRPLLPVSSEALAHQATAA